MDELTYVFHEGERRVQALAGETAVADQNSAMVQKRVMGGALPFLRQQGFAVFALEIRGQVWCSPMFGRPGFIESVDGREVRFAADAVTEPMLVEAARQGCDAGVLVIDLATRRRIRINGQLTREDGGKLLLTVAESYPNCPKYITRRLLQWEVGPGTELLVLREGVAFGEEQEASLTRADLLFVATKHPSRGADASHRGGLPGFVRVIGGRGLEFADYAGNGMFNTLGNLAVDGRIGLLVPDLVRKVMVQLTGTGSLRWDGDVAEAGTGRVVGVEVRAWRELPLGLKGAEFLDYSPYDPEVRR